MRTLESRVPRTAARSRGQRFRSVTLGAIRGRVGSCQPGATVLDGCGPAAPAVVADSTDLAGARVAPTAAL